MKGEKKWEKQNNISISLKDMSLKEQIGRDLKEALKAQKPIKVGTLRMLSAAIFNKEKEKRYSLTKEKPDLTEQDLEKESELTNQ